MLHSCSTMYFSLAVTSMRVELPSGKVPTTLVLLLISRLMRSIPLFVLIWRQCSGGNSVYASVSASPSRTVLRPSRAALTPASPPPPRPFWRMPRAIPARGSPSACAPRLSAWSREPFPARCGRNAPCSAGSGPRGTPPRAHRASPRTCRR